MYHVLTYTYIIYNVYIILYVRSLPTLVRTVLGDTQLNIKLITVDPHNTAALATGEKYLGLESERHGIEGGGGRQLMEGRY